MTISPTLRRTMKIAKYLSNDTVSGALGTISTVLTIVSSLFAVRKDIKEFFAKKKD